VIEVAAVPPCRRENFYWSIPTPHPINTWVISFRHCLPTGRQCPYCGTGGWERNQDSYRLCSQTEKSENSEAQCQHYSKQMWSALERMKK
jgi:hypothetical protein